jgi:transposase
MSRRLTVMPHLPVDQLEGRYRQARDPVARSQWQIVWLVAQGQVARQVAASTSYSTKWISTIIHRYNATGPSGIGDRRHANPGKAPILSAQQQAALQVVLASPPPDGGLWSGPKVAAWIKEQTGQAVLPQCGWAYLKRLGCVLRRPRPQHAKADPAAQETFKKGSWLRR